MTRRSARASRPSSVRLLGSRSARAVWPSGERRVSVRFLSFSTSYGRGHPRARRAAQSEVCVERRAPLRAPLARPPACTPGASGTRTGARRPSRRAGLRAVRAQLGQLVGPLLLVAPPSLIDDPGRRARVPRPFARERPRHGPAARLPRPNACSAICRANASSSTRPTRSSRSSTSRTSPASKPAASEPALQLPAAAGANRQEPESALVAVLRACGRASRVARREPSGVIG